MKVVIQRVTEASVKVDGNTVGSIGKGLLCLVGIGRDDEEEDLKWCCRKLLNARLWSNENDKPWMTSVLQNNYDLLLVSQFTLHGYLNGNKLDFHLAMSPAKAKQMYDSFVQQVKAAHQNPEQVQEGVFGAYMAVSSVNDGPVTVIIDSKERKASKS